MSRTRIAIVAAAVTAGLAGVSAGIAAAGPSTHASTVTVAADPLPPAPHQRGVPVPDVIAPPAAAPQVAAAATKPKAATSAPSATPQAPNPLCLAPRTPSSPACYNGQLDPNADMVEVRIVQDGWCQGMGAMEAASMGYTAADEVPAADCAPTGQYVPGGYVAPAPAPTTTSTTTAPPTTPTTAPAETAPTVSSYPAATVVAPSKVTGAAPTQSRAADRSTIHPSRRV